MVTDGATVLGSIQAPAPAQTLTCALNDTSPSWSVCMQGPASSLTYCYGKLLVSPLKVMHVGQCLATHKALRIAEKDLPHALHHRLSMVRTQCGEMSTLSLPHKGLAGSRGLCSTTSRAAPASAPHCTSGTQVTGVRMLFHCTG